MTNQPQKQLNECEKIDTNLISDGYHTFGELYEHRFALFIALCRLADLAWVHNLPNKDGNPLPRPWRAKLQSDGTMFPGWFIMGIGTEKGKQMTYHLPISKWKETEFAEDFEKSPCEFDGHTSNDVIQRLYKL